MGRSGPARYSSPSAGSSCPCSLSTAGRGSFSTISLSLFMVLLPVEGSSADEEMRLNHANRRGLVKAMERKETRSIPLSLMAHDLYYR